MDVALYTATLEDVATFRSEAFRREVDLFLMVHHLDPRTKWDELPTDEQMRILDAASKRRPPCFCD